MKTETFRLEKATSHLHFSEIALLHIQEIHHGMLPTFGHMFLARLYSQLALASRSGVYVVMENSKVVGFLAGTADIKKCYSSVLVKGWPFLILPVLSSLLRMSVIKDIITLLTYPFTSLTAQEHKIENCSAIKSEILAIAVAPELQGRGIGRELIEAFQEDLAGWNTHGYYRVATNVAEESSNSFYRKLGFIPCHQVRHNNLTLQVYLKPVSGADSLLKEE